MNQIVVEDTHIWSDIESDWSETGRRYVELVERLVGSTFRWSDTARRSDRLVRDWSKTRTTGRAAEGTGQHCYDAYVYVGLSLHLRV